MKSLDTYIIEKLDLNDVKLDSLPKGLRYIGNIRWKVKNLKNVNPAKKNWYVHEQNKENNSRLVFFSTESRVIFFININDDQWIETCTVNDNITKNPEEFYYNMINDYLYLLKNTYQYNKVNVEYDKTVDEIVKKWKN